MLAEQNKHPNNYTQTSIYIEEYATQEDLHGIVIHQLSDRTWHFESLIEFMNLYEELLNQLDFPQPTHEFRKMGDGKSSDLLSENLSLPFSVQKDPDFIIDITHRHNASWQGRVQITRSSERKFFASSLELIRIIDAEMLSQSH